ncbi:Ig-like domain-containing protein [Undibacterium sp. Ji22W]|uniref:Ig-like domain-containing protein n=1 Tax=Undibacterium sp. Ji22W TaxID=3413038 RepID=UPI003BF03955
MNNKRISTDTRSITEDLDHYSLSDSLAFFNSSMPIETNNPQVILPMYSFGPMYASPPVASTFNGILTSLSDVAAANTYLLSGNVILTINLASATSGTYAIDLTGFGVGDMLNIVSASTGMSVITNPSVYPATYLDSYYDFPDDYEIQENATLSGTTLILEHLYTHYIALGPATYDDHVPLYRLTVTGLTGITADAITYTYNDVTHPTLTISSDIASVKSGDTSNITFTFSENPGDTFTWDGSSGDVVVTGGTLGAITGSGLTRTATFTAGTGSNTASISVEGTSYTDVSGNGGGAATTSLDIVLNSSPTGSVTISGTAREGRTLSVTNNLTDADGIGTISYVWKADGNTIDGAIGTTLLLTQAQVGKEITAVASYTDLNETLEIISSAATGVVADNAVPSSTNKNVTISEDTSLTLGIANFGFSDSDSGDTLQAVMVTSLPLQGSLRLNGNNVSENQSISATDVLAGRLVFTPVANTNGNAYASIGFKVSDGIDVSTNSANLMVNVANVNDAPTGLVTISGRLIVGQVLTASNTLVDTDGLGSITYVWKANGITIKSENLAAYTLRSTDTGKNISVSAVYTDQGGNFESMSSAATGAVQDNNHAPTGSVTWSGINRQGEMLTASNTLADVDGMGVITYQWRANGVDIHGATNPNFTMGQNEVGKYISVSAIYIDQLGNAERVNSGSTLQVVNVNDAPTGNVTLSGNAKVGQVLSVNSTVNDLDGMGTIYYLWMADGVKIKGASSPTYTIKAAELGKAISVKIYYTDLLGTNESVTSMPTTAVAPSNGLLAFGLSSSGAESALRDLSNSWMPTPKFSQQVAGLSIFEAESLHQSSNSSVGVEDINWHYPVSDSLAELVVVGHLNHTMFYS